MSSWQRTGDAGSFLTGSAALGIGSGQVDVVVEGFQGCLVDLVEIPVLSHDGFAAAVGPDGKSVLGVVVIVGFSYWCLSEDA